MSEPRLRHVQCLSPTGLHRMAYWEWGNPAASRVVVCVHGLSRQGRDFDTLARDLSSDARVICPDVVGRGQSEWLADPKAYGVPTYVADMVTLLARLDVEQVDWVGTSMGGLIGLVLAGLPKAPVRRLVLNDVGPQVSWSSIERFKAYVGQPVRFESVEQAAAMLWPLSTGFGPHTPEQWLALTRPMVKPAADGAGLELHYDPGIGVPIRSMTREMADMGEAMLWRSYDGIRCPTLLLRGADSELLTRETADAMAQRGPKARVHEFAGVGHAPTLVQADQRAVVREFLLGP